MEGFPKYGIVRYKRREFKVHEHSHDSSNYNFAFGLGIGLNVLFSAVEVGFGIYADSLALLADAGHNISDVLGLVLAWGAAFMASRAATETRTYGFRKMTIMASLISAIILILALGGIIWEALGRFLTPKPVDGPVVILVAAVGVVINTITALLFLSGQKHDLNIRGAFLHMAADAGISFGVVVAAVVIMLTGWFWIDPVISLVVVAIILIGTWGLLREAGNLAIDAVPRGMDITGIRAYLNTIESVIGVHDLHVWAMSTTEVALTVHLVVEDTERNNELLEEVQNYLHENFGIKHSTVQIEGASGPYDCLLDNECC